MFDTYLVYAVGRRARHRGPALGARAGALRGGDEAARPAAGAAAQRLLLPLTLELTDEELDAVEAHREVLDRVGFEVEPFGGRTVVLNAVPNPHPRFDAARCFREMVADLARGRFGGWANRLERFAATYACRAAVKAGTALSEREMRELLLRLFATDAAAARRARPLARSCSCRARSWSGGLAATVALTPVLVGPDRASARRRWRVALAAHLPIEVISADSRQVYRRLDIGTAKPTQKERRRGAASRARPGRAGRALQRGAVRPGGGGVDRGRAVAGEAAGRGRRHRALRAGAGRGTVRAAAARSGAAARRSRRWASGLDAARAGALGGAARSRVSRAAGASARSRAIEVALLTGQPLSTLAARGAERQARSCPWYVRLTVPRPVLHQRIRHRAEADGPARADRGSGGGAGRRRDRPGSPGSTASGIREAVAVPHGRRRPGQRWPRRSPSARGSTPSGRRPGFGISCRGDGADARCDPAGRRSSRRRSPRLWSRSWSQ